MDEKPIMMPFVHLKSTKNSHKSDIDNSRSQQIYAWTKFNNRRNTTRIQRYFQVLHDKRVTLTYNFVSIILCFISIWVATLLIDKFLSQSDKKYGDSIVEVLYESLCEHAVHTLRDPTFFSEYFPNYFANPYKYPLSAETAPIYAQGFLYAFKYTAGYVTSWKAGDINGKLIGLNSADDNPYIAYLLYCNGTSQPTLGWRSSFADLNSSYPTEYGAVISNDDVIYEDWFIAGNNATGPLISELYLKRNDTNFIPQYTLVFPAINFETQKSDFVFSFELTLLKVQQFLQSLSVNISTNSRLAVTTTENVLIAVTGEDQPIDAFNNEIVTKKIKQLEDPVWNCVSHDDSFDRVDNFSTQCSFKLENGDDRDNVTLTYNVFRTLVKIGKVTTWNFIAVLENTLESDPPHMIKVYPSVETAEWTNHYITPFIIGFVITLVGWFLLIVLYFFTPYLARVFVKISKEDNKKENDKKEEDDKIAKRKLLMKKRTSAEILSLFGWSHSNHSRPVGVLNAISELKYVEDSRELPKKEAVESMVAQRALFEIRENSFGCPTFNETEFFARIKGEKLREKFRKIFGNQFDAPLENDNDGQEKIPEESIMESRTTSFNIRNPAFDRTSLILLEDSNNEKANSDDDEEKREKFLFAPETSDDSVQTIIRIISVTNSYFNPGGFEKLVGDSLKRIPSDFGFFPSNAFCFIDKMFKMQLQLTSMLFDQDMQMALYLAEIAFQDVMGTRRSKENVFTDSPSNYGARLMNQIFIKDVSLVMKNARQLLYSLYIARNGSFEEEEAINSESDDVVTINIPTDLNAKSEDESSTAASHKNKSEVNNNNNNNSRKEEDDSEESNNSDNDNNNNNSRKEDYDNEESNNSENDNNNNSREKNDDDESNNNSENDNNNNNSRKENDDDNDSSEKENSEIEEEEKRRSNKVKIIFNEKNDTNGGSDSKFQKRKGNQKDESNSSDEERKRRSYFFFGYHNEADFAKQTDLRWTKICEYTFEILRTTPLSNHIEVIMKSQIFLTSKITKTKLTSRESMILLKLLYITSMISFLFDNRNSKTGSSLLGIEDDDEMGGIMDCLYGNLVYPEMQALNQIFGTKYFVNSRKY